MKYVYECGDEQYDHHCIISFLDWNWRIYKAAKDLLYVAREVTEVSFIKTVIDTSRVDWRAYSEAALQMDYEQLADQLVKFSTLGR